MRPLSDPHSDPQMDHHQLAEELRRTSADSLLRPPPGLISGIVDQLPERRTNSTVKWNPFGTRAPLQPSSPAASGGGVRAQALRSDDGGGSEFPRGESAPPHQSSPVANGGGVIAQVRRSDDGGGSGNPRGNTSTIVQISSHLSPRSRQTTALLLAAAAAIALTALAWFFIPAAQNTRASEALSKSLNVLPKSGFAQLLLDPVEQETRSLVLQTRRATDSLRFSLPITRLP